MNDRFVIAIQARTGATRLPGKMTRAFFEDCTILDLILKELQTQFPSENLVIATSTNPADDAIADVGIQHAIRCERGSENDVLNRVADAVRTDPVEWVVRVCADNPFLRAEFVGQLLGECDGNHYDYASFMLPDATPVILSHLGLFSEVIRKETLLKIDEMATSERHREHLTSHILDHPEQYDRKLLPIPDYIQQLDFLRLTVDTAEDFETCRGLYAETVGAFGTDFSAAQLVSVIEKTPHVHQKMAAAIAANEKR